MTAYRHHHDSRVERHCATLLCKRLHNAGAQVKVQNQTLLHKLCSQGVVTPPLTTNFMELRRRNFQWKGMGGHGATEGTRENKRSRQMQAGFFLKCGHLYAPQISMIASVSNLWNSMGMPYNKKANQRHGEWEHIHEHFMVHLSF